jgi:23S rRNA U2552 (ribose-2'-O)-methylase RlmE/FtsJ
MLAVEYPVLRASIHVVPADTECLAHVAQTPTKRAHTLDELKARVPETKKRVGHAAWYRQFDFQRTKAPHTRAYHKMREIALSCALDPPSMSVHLCEAPGAFVVATAEFGAPDWTWIALSSASGLAPFDHTLLPSDCGYFVTCDVRSYDECTPHVPRSTACLVTADGATGEHEALEEEHADLLVAQTRLAIYCLRAGGTYVAKFFEGRCRATTCAWIAWLTTIFGTVGIIKPTWSRATNSERYLVARDFVGGSDIAKQLVMPPLHTIVVAEKWYQHLEGIIDAMLGDQATHLHAALARHVL